MKFRADVYKEIFHSDDTNEQAAQIVKPQKPEAEEKEKKQPTQDCTPEPMDEPREKETVVTGEDAPQEED